MSAETNRPISEEKLTSTVPLERRHGERRISAKSPIIRATEEDPLSFGLKSGDRRATHRPDRLTRLTTDLAVYDELLLDEGKNIERIDEETAQLLEIFQVSRPERQTDLINSLKKSINRRLRGRLVSSLNLSHDLQMEDGIDSNSIGKDENVWRKLFDQSSNTDRLEIVRSIEKMAEDMLIKNFGKYLEEWKQMLANDPTMKHEDARQQIMKQRQKFEHASRRGRIGLSKHLRETIDASSIAGFSALLGLYEELLEKNVYRKTGLPTLETWIETYDNASYNRKHGVINELRSKISVLMTEPSPTESTDSK